MRAGPAVAGKSCAGAAASGPPLLDRLGVRRPVHGGVRARLPGADRLLDLPQPLPRPAHRRHHLRRPRQLPQALQRPAVLGGVRPGRGCSSPSRCRSCWSSPCWSRSRSTAGGSTARRFFRISIFLPYAVPAVVATLMWGFMYGDAVRPGRRTSTTRSASSLPDPLVARPGARLDRQHRHLGVRRLQHADLLLGAAGRSRARSTRPPRSTAPAQFRIITAIKLPAIRGALVIATIFSIIGSFQLFNEPSILQTLAPNAITTYFTPEHVRLLAVLLRPAVQLLRHGRDRHGRDHDGHRLRRPAPRHAEGSVTMSATAATASDPHAAPRRAGCAPVAQPPPLSRVC